MKKLVLCGLLVAGFLFQYCTSSKKVADVPRTTYTADVAPLITQNCSPCHIPPRGNKGPLNTFETAKANIDESIERINKAPGDRGFMPFKHPKLSDSVINVFVKWKADGLLEK